MIWLFLGAVVLIAVAPFLRYRLRPAVAQQNAPGELVRLSQGITHYQWVGPVRGPVLVCIHGLTTPMAAWAVIAEELGRAGYRVLTYDLYGRGYSADASGPQDRRFFLTQLQDLLTDQGVTEDVTLLGYSMGGSIATAYAAQHPERIKRVILLAPAGMQINRTGMDRAVLRLPLIGDWLFATVGVRRMRRALRAAAGDPTQVIDINQVQQAQFARKGFAPAVLSSLRGMLSEVQEADHRALGRAGVPVVAIWGEADTVIPLRALGILAQWNRAARQETVPGAGHGLPYTHGTQVAEIIRGILRERE